MDPSVASNLLAARSQMASTLGFHIVLACLGVALPAIVLIANAIGVRWSDPAALLLARRWALVMAVTFAAGAGEQSCARVAGGGHPDWQSGR